MPQYVEITSFEETGPDGTKFVDGNNESCVLLPDGSTNLGYFLHQNLMIIQNGRPLASHSVFLHVKNLTDCNTGITLMIEPFNDIKCGGMQFCSRVATPDGMCQLECPCSSPKCKLIVAAVQHQYSKSWQLCEITVS